MVGMTDTLSKLDYEALHGPMTNRLTALGRSLTAEQWAAPSLCEGWRVCDVFGHMTYGGATPMYRVLPRLLFLYRGNLNRGSAVESVRYADTHTQQAVMTEFERSSHHPVGIGKVIKASELHMDHIVQEMDIRRARRRSAAGHVRSSGRPGHVARWWSRRADEADRPLTQTAAETSTRASLKLAPPARSAR